MLARLGTSDGDSPAAFMLCAYTHYVNILARQCFIKIMDIGKIHLRSELPVPAGALCRHIGLIRHSDKATSRFCREKKGVILLMSPQAGYQQHSVNPPGPLFQRGRI
jgi:hypothetical protein